MPIYVYEVITGDDSEGEQFEIFQSMADAPLTKHPETGQPIRRVFLAPAVGGKWSDSAMGKSVADDKKLGKMGFTKYVKAGDGLGRVDELLAWCEFLDVDIRIPRIANRRIIGAQKGPYRVDQNPVGGSRAVPVDGQNDRVHVDRCTSKRA